MIVLGQPAKKTLYTVADGVHRPRRETERRWATSSQNGWVVTWDPATLATVLRNPGAGDDAGCKIVLPSFGKTPPAAEACCTLSGEPTDDGGFTVVVVEPPNGSVLWYCHVGSSSPAAAWEKVEYDVKTLLG
ncbi:hypothetical protein E2562_026583 [Oryza meyeriana var. granulata]|uniref:DUF1618 domain-containing protein n=1 Tax=Oryza meyeriana var. granulata TaxID=110450 RepID=A0A6G1CT84_9ORYZ|nr:hypothetical protein E2562_026583 [Oryza meyeriana var. granulata]